MQDFLIFLLYNVVVNINQNIVNIITDNPVLTKEQTIAHFKAGNYEALVLSLSKMIITLMQKSNITIEGKSIMDAYADDFISYCWLELYKIVHKWDPNIAGWSTFAFYYIRKFLRDYLRNTGSLNQGTITRLHKMKDVCVDDVDRDVYVLNDYNMPFDNIEELQDREVLDKISKDLKELALLVYSVKAPRALDKASKQRIFELVKELKLRRSNNYKIFNSSYFAHLKISILRRITKELDELELI